MFKNLKNLTICVYPSQICEVIPYLASKLNNFKRLHLKLDVCKDYKYINIRDEIKDHYHNIHPKSIEISSFEDNIDFA